MKIGITGINGLIGWHLRAYLHRRHDIEVRGADRATFADPTALAEFVTGLDAVVHLAAMNRGEDAELEVVNVHLVETLIAACESAGSAPHIVFSSSTHCESDTAYGRSKKIGAGRFRRWAEKRHTTFTNMILPHVFGEFGKPFYNSVVSTFCYQLANGEAPSIISDSQLELVHAQAVAERVLFAVEAHEDGDARVPGERIAVSELLETLRSMSVQYGSQVIPDLRNSLDLRLFNVCRSYLFPSHYPVDVLVRADERGELFETVRTLSGGQMFLSTTKPGVTRGNHYHARKLERFLVVKGEAVIRLRKLFSNQVVEFRVSGRKPQYIDMPTLYTHDITNVGQGELITAFWAHEIFDPKDTDTFPESVEKNEQA